VRALVLRLLRVLDQPCTLLKLARISQERSGNFVVSGEVSYSETLPRFIMQLGLLLLHEHPWRGIIPTSRATLLGSGLH
jgi:hypothetical protein